MLMCYTISSYIVEVRSTDSMHHQQAKGFTQHHSSLQRSGAGFTLIELIITISILAVLVAIVVVALNPAEQLARARDTKRVADLDGIRTALNLYAATATGTINLTGDTATANDYCVNGSGSGGKRYYINSVPGTFTSPGSFTTVTSTGQSVPSATVVASTTTWLPALLGQTPGGSPLAVLPLDPTNGSGTGSTYFYAYACEKNNKTYELTARLESTYFSTALNLPGTDGGNSSSTYEVGTDLTLIPNAF